MIDYEDPEILGEFPLVWSPHTKEYVEAPPQRTFEELSPPQQRAVEFMARLDMPDLSHLPGRWRHPNRNINKG